MSELEIFAKYFKVYLNCSPEIQRHTRNLVDIVIKQEDPLEVSIALGTLNTMLGEK